MAWFAMTCWLIWNRRNNVRVHQPVIPLDRIALSARDHLVEFHKFPQHGTQESLASKEDLEAS